MIVPLLVSSGVALFDDEAYKSFASSSKMLEEDRDDGYDSDLGPPSVGYEGLLDWRLDPQLSLSDWVIEIKRVTLRSFHCEHKCEENTECGKCESTKTSC